MSDAKRATIRQEVGEEIEDLIARYTRLTWMPNTIPGIRARLDAMSPLERDVLLVRLANELEDHLDLGILYPLDHKRRRAFMETDLPATVEMAERLGVPALAKGLAETSAEVSSARLSPALRRPHGESSGSRSPRIAPACAWR
jgi:(p)ppGpp synthase/HD superfamily hydrolase